MLPQRTVQARGVVRGEAVPDVRVPQGQWCGLLGEETRVVRNGAGGPSVLPVASCERSGREILAPQLLRARPRAVVDTFESHLVETTSVTAPDRLSEPIPLQRHQSTAQKHAVAAQVETRHDEQDPAPRSYRL